MSDKRTDRRSSYWDSLSDSMTQFATGVDPQALKDENVALASKVLELQDAQEQLRKQLQTAVADHQDTKHQTEMNVAFFNMLFPSYVGSFSFRAHPDQSGTDRLVTI